MHVMNANNRQITCLNQSSLKPLARCYLDNQIVGAPPLSASLWRCRTLMQREMGILNGSFFALPISLSLPLSLRASFSLSHLHTLRNKVLCGFSGELQFRNLMLNDCFRQYCWFDLPQLWAQSAATHGCALWKITVNYAFSLDQLFHPKVCCTSVCSRYLSLLKDSLNFILLPLSISIWKCCGQKSLFSIV